jgi:hypothetical protein
MPDPLKLRILCSECGTLLKGAPPCGAFLRPANSALGEDGEYEQCESTEFEPYIPLRFVPEEIIEELRAQELEASMKGGNRKLTEEERERGLPTAAEVVLPEEPEPEAPATGEEIPPELLDQEGFSS